MEKEKERERERGGKIRPPNTGNVQSSSKSFYSSYAALDSQTQMFLFPKEGMPHCSLKEKEGGNLERKKLERGKTEKN